MAPVTGSLSFRLADTNYTLQFPDRGWLAIEMLRFIDEILEAPEPRVEVLKLLGLAVEISREAPVRTARHWIEVDLDRKRLISNSDWIRAAVRRKVLAEDDPVSPLTLEKIYRNLDLHDFSVELHRSTG